MTVVTPWHECHELAGAYWRAMSVLEPDDRVIVVDNGSRRPVEIPAEERFRAIRAERNLGFGRASNLGLAEAKTDAVLFLNNDVRASSATWLEQLRQALQPGRLVGAHLRRDPHTAVDGRIIPYLDGWCLAGMTDDLRNLGGWSQKMEEPAYWGDNLLCVQAVAAGMRLVEVPVGLRHLANYTSRRMNVDGVSARNRERYQQAVRELLPTEVEA